MASCLMSREEGSPWAPEPAHSSLSGPPEGKQVLRSSMWTGKGRQPDVVQIHSAALAMAF